MVATISCPEKAGQHTTGLGWLKPERDIIHKNGRYVKLELDPPAAPHARALGRMDAASRPSDRIFIWNTRRVEIVESKAHAVNSYADGLDSLTIE